MTAAEEEAARNIIQASETLLYKRVFFLGPYARRVSFASQQHRALNLIWALQGLGRISRGQRIAVVGGGLSGMTASAALLDLGYEVVILEAGGEAMPRQSDATHRYIHPTINRWPEMPIVETTMVPYLDWMSDVCSDLVADLRARWNLIVAKHAPIFERHVEVTGFVETEEEVSLQTSEACDARNERFNAVLVMSGFADEHYDENDLFPGYWSPDGLDRFVDSKKGKNVSFFISGCGDGGLIDALRVAHKQFDKGRLVVDTARSLNEADWPWSTRIRDAELALANDRAKLKSALSDGSEDLKAVYEAAARDLPPAIEHHLARSFRTGRNPNFITVLSLEKNAYSPMAAPIHKLLYAHANRHMHVTHRSCEVVAHDAGSITVKNPKGSTRKPEETLKGKIILRHGAKPNFDEFFEDNPSVGKDLIERQKLFAPNLDQAFWKDGDARIKVWPPRENVREELVKRRDLAARLVTRIVGHAHGRMQYDEDKGFFFVHPNEPEVVERVAKLPKKVFGFELAALSDVPAPDADTPVAGLAESERGIADHRKPLRPGSRIFSSLNGRLGPLLEDADGRLFALTAAHLGPGHADLSMPVNDERGVAVGSFVQLEERDVASDLAMLEISPDRGVDPGYAQRPTLDGIIGPHEAAAGEVFLERASGVLVPGYISATLAPVRFRRPGSDVRVVVPNTVRIRSAVPSSPFAVAGDSGAPVVDGAGRLLGIVLCADERDTFVLPLADVIERLQLSLVTDRREASVPPVVTAAELSPISQALRLYAEANRRDVRQVVVDLGEPPTDLDEVEPEEAELA